MANGRSLAVAVLACTLAMAACRSEEPDVPPPPPRLLQVYADVGLAWANVTVWRGGVLLDGARVVVNGFALAPSERGAGMYVGDLPVALHPGDRVSLDVTIDDLRVTGRA